MFFAKPRSPVASIGICDAKRVNLISGTYTYDRAFTVYDLSNVVLNITDTTFVPTLEPNQNYNFTMMGVSEDNWVNLFIRKTFVTE